MKKLSWKKVGCLLLALLMAATMLATGVVAAYDNVYNSDNLPETGSITITKLDRDENSSYPDPALKNDGTKVENITSAGKGLNGVTFTIYKVDPNYTVPENGDVSNVAIEANKVDEGTTATVEGQDGVLVFDGLGMYQRYLIVETDAPAYVTTSTAPFCVDLPMTNSTGDGWMADVYVYPKNYTTRGTVTLNKVGEDDEALPGAIFGLYQATKSGDDYTLVMQDNNPVLVTEAVIPATASTDENYTGNAYAMSDSDGLVKFTNIPVGAYALIEVKAPSGYALDKTPHFFSIAKGSQMDAVVNLSKVVNYETLSDNAIVKKVNTDGATGVNWTVKTDLPANIETYQKYEIVDPVPNQVTLDSTSILVKATKEGTDALTLKIENRDYTLTIDTTNSNKFTVALTEDGMKKVAGYDALEITFDSTIKKGATLGVVTNTATLNAVAEEGEEFTDNATATTTIYGVEINKVNFKGELLANAEFALFTSKNDAEAVVSAIKEGTEPDLDAALYTGTTTADAKLLLSAMNAGTYYLVETKAPAGYKQLNRVVEVTIEGNEEGYTAEVTILNTANVSLPITGGIGTLIFTFSGIALMGAAALLYIRSRKKKATEA
jgi:fimbrial isopeptide formation D2 family protein/LPXTG-motif cell wall-anchored protein